MTESVQANSILILLSSPPSQDMEPLELALALAAFDHPVTLLCIGAGLGWLVSTQQPRKDQGKSPDKLVSALPMYDIDQIWYAKSALADWSLDAEQLTPLAQSLDDAGIRELIRQHQHCLRF